MESENMGEYLLKCPTCGSQTKLLCREDVEPVVMVCQGCGRALIMHQNRLFTVPLMSMVNLMRDHRVKVCGNIVATKLSDEAQSMVEDRRLSELRHALEGNEDVLDIIRKF